MGSSGDGVSEALGGAGGFLGGLLLSTACHGFNAGFVVHRRPKTSNSHSNKTQAQDQRPPSLPFDVTQHRRNQSNQQKALAACV